MSQSRENHPQRSPPDKQDVKSDDDELSTDASIGATAPLSSSSPASPLSIEGRFGRYEIKRELGRGAMGAVYLAKDTVLERMVALKTPHFKRNDDEHLKRFFREARAMSSLSHRNICPVYDIGKIDSVSYLTMQLVEGGTLSERLKQSPPYSAREAAELVLKLSIAMDSAHQARVVHRDLKPGNIMLDAEGEPVIMDFGLAQRLTAEEATLTGSGEILGTPAYMAPEQVNKEHEIGPPCDVYALGVILYELLAGRRPFGGSVGSVFASILTQEPQSPSSWNSDVDLEIEGICAKAMAKQIEQRFPSAADLANALRDYLKSDLGAHAKPRRGQADSGSTAVTLSVPKTKPTRKRSVVALASTLLAVLGLGCVATVAYQSGCTPAPPLNRATAEPEHVEDTTASQPPEPVLPSGLTFDGQSTVTLTGVPSTIPLCIEAYLTPTKTDSTHHIFELGGDIILMVDESDWLGLISTSDANYQVFGEQPVAENERVHVAMVRESGEFRLYVNGELTDVNSLSVGAFESSPESLIIGRLFEGIIEEIRISNVRRYQTNFTPDPSLDPDVGTVALLRFNEGPRSEVKNVVKPNQRASVYGAKWVTADRGGGN